ncbi:DUF503 domain-containing protein [Anaerocolumna xylanovorans]|uniref:DUF503 domain-containing protein n=1 Tax=Anaerocolumna xylanovorans DSM 12503 TaxID=1121345 RepID=A0A1M7XX64_9FIRM|nr:DUF503 domain-containing protein [Anaerocolumna xylanovorans]SHO43452.1 hypothetical protein SAMN02745217_00249 [Anaerocolumna xylanovorans DSM 12503]
MRIGTLQIWLYMPWVHSLKEKRMVVKSLCAKLRNQFNLSVGEVEEQDTHQIAVFGIACVAGDTAQADSILDNVLTFVESNTEGEITKIEREIL